MIKIERSTNGVSAAASSAAIALAAGLWILGSRSGVSSAALSGVAPVGDKSENLVPLGAETDAGLSALVTPDLETVVESPEVKQLVERVVSSYSTLPAKESESLKKQLKDAQSTQDELSSFDRMIFNAEQSPSNRTIYAIPTAVQRLTSDYLRSEKLKDNPEFVAAAKQVKTRLDELEKQVLASKAKSTAIGDVDFQGLQRSVHILIATAKTPFTGKVERDDANSYLEGMGQTIKQLQGALDPDATQLEALKLEGKVKDPEQYLKDCAKSRHELALRLLSQMEIVFPESNLPALQSSDVGQVQTGDNRYRFLHQNSDQYAATIATLAEWIQEAEIALAHKN